MNSHAVRDVFVQAKGFVEKGWCQRHFALNARKEVVYSGDADAVCWCVAGAINAASPSRRVRGHAETFIMRHLGCSHTEWNDRIGRTKEEVLTMLDRCIAACDKESDSETLS